jgi:hypothetical protein
VVSTGLVITRDALWLHSLGWRALRSVP